VTTSFCLDLARTDWLAAADCLSGTAWCVVHREILAPLACPVSGSRSIGLASGVLQTVDGVVGWGT
jgi:hypothetical protein